MQACDDQLAAGPNRSRINDLNVGIETVRIAVEAVQNASEGGLIHDSTGNFYGATQDGGTYDYGVAFKLSLSNGNWVEAVGFAGIFDAVAGWPGSADGVDAERGGWFRHVEHGDRAVTEWLDRRLRPEPDAVDTGHLQLLRAVVKIHVVEP